ncbi:MAG: GntR family transcriptional regulator [Lachnospiraceae bacterium]|nr:GntR family transcriptional regulator [Lachnospiraceae bacterium]
MITLDYSDSRPIYEQIVEKYKLLILKGVLVPDEQMPSVRNLAMEISTNPNTVQKAFAELERQGFIYSVKGRGNFVAANPSLLEERKKQIARELALKFKEAASIGIPKGELLDAVADAEKELDKEDSHD